VGSLNALHGLTCPPVITDSCRLADMESPANVVSRHIDYLFFQPPPIE